MEMAKTKGAWLIFVVALAAMLALAGCSEAPATSDSTHHTACAPRTIVGTQAGASKAIIVKNGLGAEITMVSVNAAGSKDEPHMLSIGGTWNDDGYVMMFVPAGNETVPSDFVLTTAKREYVLHDVDFSAFEEAIVKKKDKIGYLVYKADGKKVKTLAHEQKLVEKEKAKKEAARVKAEAEAEAAAAQAEAEAAAAAPVEEPVYEQPVYEEPVYEEPAPEAYYEEPVYEEPVYEEPAPEVYYEEPAA